MPETNIPASRGGSFLPLVLLISLVALLTIGFIALLFPWDSVGRRIAWEIGRVSGAQVTVRGLSPAISARGPVLRAQDVTIEHPAVDNVRLSILEIAPRFSTSWLGGDPTLRIWAETGLGNADGVLQLGSEPAYVGRVTNVELARLPLRLRASAVKLSGRLDADADVALDPDGTLGGRVEFDSPSLKVEASLLPVALTFSSATGVIEILDTGATRITDVRLDGDVVQGEISGEVGLVHRSQSPPLDMTARLRILDPALRQLALGAGLKLDSNYESRVRIGGTANAPTLTPISETIREITSETTRANRDRPGRAQ